jgi:RNA polymerase sigma-70 factor, ECF subfamily
MHKHYPNGQGLFREIVSMETEHRFAPKRMSRRYALHLDLCPMSPRSRASAAGMRGEASIVLVDEADLARALLDGRRGAAPVAWRRFYPIVIATLRRLLGPSDDLPDLAQDVFARFFVKLRDLKKHGSLRAFVTGIAFRRAREEIKRRRVRRSSAAMVLHHMNELSLAGIMDPERRHAAFRLYRMMSSMGENDRTAYTLRVVEGLELNEIAEVLGVSLSTVRRSIRRASEQLDRLVNDGTLPVRRSLRRDRPAARASHRHTLPS